MATWMTRVQTFFLAFICCWTASIAGISGLFLLMTEIDPFTPATIAQTAAGVAPTAGFISLLWSVATMRRQKRNLKHKHK
ncbi:hypothetical protein [Ramlibacter aurantiacus]|uniref:hypothetical protein n=1 Tax=Ramlibacter aurantiacus TaxID=2801330 RepID=UPI001F163511|nr:hypothetical protein [Ramlibacter aurantiacus]